MKLFIQQANKRSLKLQNLETFSSMSHDEMMDWSGGYGNTSGGSIGKGKGKGMPNVSPGHGSSCGGGCHNPNQFSGNNGGSSYGSTSGGPNVWKMDPNWFPGSEDLPHPGSGLPRWKHFKILNEGGNPFKI